MNRSELERPSSGEAYVGGLSPDQLRDIEEYQRRLDLFFDSPSMPVQPVWVGFAPLVKDGG